MVIWSCPGGRAGRGGGCWVAEFVVFVAGVIIWSRVIGDRSKSLAVCTSGSETTSRRRSGVNVPSLA